MASHWPQTVTAAGLALAVAGVTHAQKRHANAADSAPATPAASVELDPITVTAPHGNPLDESMERLRRMMEEAPCLGCGPDQEAARRSIYEETYYGVGAVLSFFSGMPEKPPNPTAEERLEARVVGDWRRYERAPAEND